MYPFKAGSGLPPETNLGLSGWSTSNSPVETPFTTQSSSFEHRFQLEGPSPSLPRLFPPSTTYTQALEQRITQLENENAKLKSDLQTLNAQHNTLSNAYDALLDRLPHATNSLDPLEQDDHPKVNFWFKRDWLEFRKNADDHDGVNVPQEPLRGRSRSSKGINVAMRYLEDRDGSVVDGDRASAIRDFARAVWDKLKKRGPMPASWGVADSDTRKVYYYEMAQRFYELRLCDLDWKADQIAKEGYSYWHGSQPMDDVVAANTKSKRSRVVSIKATLDSESKRLKANDLDAIVHDNPSGLPLVVPDLTGAMIPEPCLPFIGMLDSEPDFGIPNLVSMATILPDFPALPMATDPVILGAGPSTSAHSGMTAGHGLGVGSGGNIVSGDTFQSTIFPSYSETASAGAAGVSMPLTTVNPSMIAPQPGLPVVKKPNKMRPNGSSTARNLCAKDWCKLNSGSADDFRLYWDNLPPHERQRYKELEAAEKQRVAPK